MKAFNKIMIPVTASALLLGACGSDATDSKENTLISSKAGDAVSYTHLTLPTICSV